MKAIKDCEWEVKITHPGNLIEITNYHMWKASCKCGIENIFHSNYDNFKSKQFAKNNWERFAKINGIKKWKYV